MSAMNKLATAICILGTTSLWSAAHADDKPAATSSSALEACQTDVKGDKKKEEWKRDSQRPST